MTLTLSSAAKMLQVWPAPNSTRCCACWSALAIKDRTRFLCRECLGQLSDKMRRDLLSTAQELAHGIMEMCLVELGVDPKSRMIRIPKAVHATKVRTEHYVVCDGCGRVQR